VDDGLFISQEKSFEKSNTFLFCSYNIIFSLFDQFGLIVKYEKSEIFYFSRLIKNFKLFSLDLTSLEDPILWLKNTWKYLGFIFDRKLSFQQHIHFYSNKALSIVKDMKMLGNSTSGLLPFHKQLLCKICVKHVFFPSLYMAYHCSTLRVLLYPISLKSLGKCNKELLYRLLVLFICLLSGKLRPSLVSFLFTSIWTRSVAINKWE